MSNLNEFITTYNIELITGLLIITVILLLVTIINQFRISAITKKYNRLVEGVDESTLEDMLIQHLDEVKYVSNKLMDVEEYCEKLNERLKLTLQKVGFIRYNAFDDMGSDLSFSAAVLDENLDGFVITSLYGRNECNTYGKPIIKGESKYQLSDEEIQAMNIAKKSGLKQKV